MFKEIIPICKSCGAALSFALKRTTVRAALYCSQREASEPQLFFLRRR